MSMNLKERKPNRWKGFDYSSENAYFITICVDKRLCSLGEIVNNKMRLNECGKIIEQCWNDLPKHYPNCVLDAFTVMPNHIHGIIVIDNSVFKPVITMENSLKLSSTKKHGLSEMVRALKTFSSRRINESFSIMDITTDATAGNGLKPFPAEMPNIPSVSRFKWQKSFHDHIIRDYKALENIRNYINTNPANWEKDVFYQ